MSNASNDETIQQRCERILQAQAARQRAREEEIARQEAEFAAEMERIEVEEKAAREAEEKRKAEEQRVAEEKRRAEEKRIAKEQRMEEQQRQEEEKRVAEEKKKLEVEKKKLRQKRSTAYTRLVEENKKEKERAAKELERRQKSISKPPQPDVQVLVPTTSPRRKTFKSKAIISDESDDEVVEQPREVMPRGAKRKRTIKMIAKGGDNLDPDVEKGDNTSLPPDPSQPHSACSRCVMIGRPSDCRPQSTRRPTQACELDEDDVYEGPAVRVGERRRVEGTEVAEQLARIAEQNQDLVKLLRQSLVVQEQMLGIMVRAEKRGMEAMEESEKGEDEDEDGEGEEDEEEIENEEEKRAKIREGKKRAE
ncbi:hypothetical protein F5890DRAFT_1636742 [Lentinula detonsa]|uniref:Uncharacterized protein n=1 Tax=Lentinula detonsa TaxID=2804962 RepID=A0AA38PQ05_9AGAR|nr:hypothetical protein F5890DRAFT_1636742 [Lentinula detonsa]